MTTTPQHTRSRRQPSSPASSTSGLLGKVLVLVAAAVGFAAVGAFLGRDLSAGVAITVTVAAFGMLVIQALGGQRFRVGDFAVGWLYAVAPAIGLGVGPVLTHYASADPSAITDAAVTTALVVAAMGTCGLTLSRGPRRLDAPADVRRIRPVGPDRGLPAHPATGGARCSVSPSRGSLQS